MKRMPLSNGRTSLDEGGRALLKVRKVTSLPENTKRKDHSILILIESILLGSSGFLNILCLIAKNRRRKGLVKVETHNPVPASNLRFFTYKELEVATGGFKEEVGSGGFGTVYKGVLPDEDVAVAVKKLFGDFRPRWYSRVQIASGIARGLLYLHEECNTTIIHCNIKPQNILLDESLAPEWLQNFPITVKVDVHSFGIVLLELITCRKSVELQMESENRIILSDWVCDCYRDGSLHLLVEEDEEATDDMKTVERFVKIAIWCIQQDPYLRPPMKTVTQMLEGAIPVPAPPEPNSFISITTSCGRGARATAGMS